MKPISLLFFLLFLLGCRCIKSVCPQQKQGTLTVSNLHNPSVAIENKYIYYSVNNSEKTYLTEKVVLLPADTALITIGADGYDEITFYVQPTNLHLVSMTILLDNDDLGSTDCSQNGKVLLNGEARHSFQSLPLRVTYQDKLSDPPLIRTLSQNEQYGPTCFMESSYFCSLNFIHNDNESLLMRVKKKWKNSDSQVNVHLDEGSGGGLLALQTLLNAATPIISN